MNRGFTLIELLVVISVVALLASIILTSLQDARTKAKDIKRVAELQQIAKALEFYHFDHGKYPEPDSTPGFSGWEVSYGEDSDDIFLEELVTGGYLSSESTDSLSESNGGQITGAHLTYNYAYYYYPIGAHGRCNSRAGRFYILGAYKLEGDYPTYTSPYPSSAAYNTYSLTSRDNVHPQSPGFNCGPNGRDYQVDFDWVIGNEG